MSTRHRMLALAVTVALGAPTAAGSQDLGFTYLEGGVVAGFVNDVEESGTITDNDFPHGIFAFSSATFFTNENVTTMRVNVIRTNGSSGLVRVSYYTYNVLYATLAVLHRREAAGYSADVTVLDPVF